MKRGMYHLQAHPSLTIIMLDFGKSPSIPGLAKTVLPDITKERCPAADHCSSYYYYAGF
jgi:hypothetical protein